MFSTRAKLLLPAVLVLLLAAGLRFYRIDIPFVEPYNSLTRQSISASVARNFYTNGFNFMNPEINENGRGPYLFNAEMPIYSYLMAIGYRLAGAPLEAVSRSVSAVFSLGVAVLLVGFLTRHCGVRSAVGAGLFLAASPLYLALSRSVQPESAMIFFTVGALLSYFAYDETGRRRFYFASLILAFAAIGTKFYNVYLFLPIAYLAWRSRGARAFRDPALWFYVVASSTALIWYVHMMRMGQTYKLAYIVYEMDKTRGPEGMSYLQTLFSPPQLFFCIKIFFIHLLTPLAIPFFLRGVFSPARTKADVFFRVWLVSVCALLLFFWKTVTDHAYYQLPLVPVCAFFVGKGVAEWRFRKGVILPVLAGLALLAQFAALAHLYPGIYFIPEPNRRIVAAGQAVDRLVPSGALVVASYGASPIQLYYANRKGWTLDIRKPGDQEGLILELESRRAEGAEFFVTTTFSQLDEVPVFKKSLEARYPALARTGDYVIYDLRHQRASGS